MMVLNLIKHHGAKKLKGDMAMCDDPGSPPGFKLKYNRISV